MLPRAAPTIGQFEKALDNLALAATNDTVVLQQLTVANLALTATIGTLTAANKTLADTVARGGGTATPGTPAGTLGGRAKSTTNLTLGTIAGPMVIASASPTPVPPAPTRGSAIAKMPRRPTPTEVARRTKAGTRCAHDGGGWHL